MAPNTFSPPTYPDKMVSNPEVFARGPAVTDGPYDPAHFVEVMNGQRIAYHARGVIPRDHCRQIMESFDQTDGKGQYSVTPRIVTVGGPPLYVSGADQIAAYFAGAEAARTKIGHVFERADAPNYIEDILTGIRAHVAAMGVVMRPAQSEGRSASYGLMREWAGADQATDGGLSARWHDDRLQLKNQAKLVETGRVYEGPVVSTCLYIENGEAGGRLLIADGRPSEEFGEQEDTSNYGFAPGIIAKMRQMAIRPEAGDVITFNASWLHAVEAASGGRRMNIAFLAGVIRDDVAADYRAHPGIHDIYARTRNGTADIAGPTIIYWS